MTIIDQNKYVQPMFLDDMGPLELQLTLLEAPYPVNITVYTSGGSTVFSEDYLADFDNKVIVDIASLVSDGFSFSIPAEGTEVVQESAKQEFNIQITTETSAGKAYASLRPVIFACSAAAASAMSDIDMLRIPRDYILPLCCFRAADQSGVQFLLPDETVDEGGYLVNDDDTPQLISRMVQLSATPAASAASFRIKIPVSEIYGPHFMVVDEPMEQYLFLNRFGGFDNIAMSGDLELQTATKHETGLFSGMSVPQESTATKKYRQNSGFMSKKTVESFAELVCSSQVYHLTGGQWKRIVIVESEIKCNSSDDLNTFSFKFTYTDSPKVAYHAISGSAPKESDAYDLQALIRRISALETSHEVLTEEAYQAKVENNGLEDKIYLTYES